MKRSSLLEGAEERYICGIAKNRIFIVTSIIIPLFILLSHLHFLLAVPCCNYVGTQVAQQRDAHGAGRQRQQGDPLPQRSEHLIQ